jgi:branched-chain amino acid aminotransferase
MPLADGKFIWRNGKIVPWAEATVHVSCHGLHYGTGVSEAMRSYDTPCGPAVFRLGTHLDRWFASARIYGMTWPYSRTDLKNAVVEVVRANRFRDCHIRAIAFYGSDQLGINPRGCPTELALLTWPNPGKTEPAAAVDVCISQWRKCSPSSVPVRTKASGQYLNSVLAAQDAATRGFTNSLSLDLHGHLSGGTSENLFLVQGKRLFTNDQESSALLGITRDSVIHIANDFGVDVYIRKLKLDDLLEAEEAFLTGTTAEIAPIATVDMKAIGKGSRGPLTARLQDAYQKAVSGRNARYRDWLTYVAPF